MVPSFPRWVLNLNPRILDGHALPDAVLAHGDAVQPTDILALGGCLGRALLDDKPVAVHEAQGLAGITHAVVLPLELELARLALLGLVELPCAVDGPVAEVALS